MTVPFWRSWMLSTPSGRKLKSLLQIFGAFYVLDNDLKKFEEKHHTMVTWKTCTIRTERFPVCMF